MSAAARRRDAEDEDGVTQPRPWPRNVSREPEMKISEIVDRLKAEFPALSLSKVRYFETEGLINPYRVGNGYRRYSKADLERLRYALTAQRDEYLPLSVIRDRLAELDASAAAPEPSAEARVVVAGGRSVVGAHLDVGALARHSGASRAQVKELVEIGVLVPDALGRFDARCLGTLGLALNANRLGIPLRNLRLVRNAAERAADAVDLAVQHKRQRSRTAAEDRARELAGVLAELHSTLLHEAVSRLD